MRIQGKTERDWRKKQFKKVKNFNNERNNFTKTVKV